MYKFYTVTKSWIIRFIRYSPICLLVLHLNYHTIPYYYLVSTWHGACLLLLYNKSTEGDKVYMSNKHKFFRSVLNISRFDYKGIKVTQVTWCLVERKTSRSVWTSHIGVTTYCGSVKHLGIAAYMSRKLIRISTVDLKQTKQESFTEAYYNSLMNTKRTGSIMWFDKTRGIGMIKDTETGDIFEAYACNIKGANSHHPELVTNVVLNSDQLVKFTLGDYHTTKNCGAINITIENTGA